MQTENKNANRNTKSKCKTENKLMVICKTITKKKYFANLKGQDDTHVGATSPSLSVCTSW
jgi:hypothetical protein